jgi:PAS domain S-box-containing protein
VSTTSQERLSTDRPLPLTTPPDLESREDDKPGSLARLAWLPIALLIVAMIVVRLLEVSWAHESPVLYGTFSALFLAGTCLLMTYLATRSYVLSGAGNLLAFGTATLLLGVTYVLAGSLITIKEHLITVQNVGFCLAGGLFLISAVQSLVERPHRADAREARRHLWLAYVAALAFMTVLVTLTMTGNFPHFYVAAQGYTPLRHVVFGTGIVAFLAAAVLFGLLYRRLPSQFLYWCALGLGLMGTAVAGAIVMGAVPGSVLAWLSRSGQWLSGIYLLVAVLSLPRHGAWLLPLQRSLREAEDRYKSLVDLSPDPILVYSGGAYVFANPAAASFLGASSPREIVGRELLDLIHPDHRPVAAAHVDLVYSGGTIAPRVARFLRLDGATVEAEVRGTRTEFDGRRAIQLMLRDMTERRQAMEALQASEEKYRSIVETAGEGIVLAHPDGSFFYVNQRMADMLGREVDELVGKSSTDFLCDDFRRIGLELRARLSAGAMPSGELKFRRKDGSMLWSHYSSSPLFDRKGAHVANLGMHTDVTEMKEAEAALRETEERLRLAQEATGFGVQDYDPQTGDVMWDERVRELWGVGSAETVTFETLEAGVHPDDREAVSAAVEAAMDPRNAGRHEIDYRVINRVDGLERWVHASWRTSFEDGRPVRMVGTVQDISDRRRAEEALRTIEAEMVAQRERSRLARDLHDSVTQALFAATLKAEALACADGSLSDGTARIAEEVRRLNRGALAQMRTLLLELRGDALEEVPVGQLLRHLVEAAEGRSAVEIRLTLRGGVETPPPLHEPIYRIAQEALNNVIRHAGAAQAWVDLGAGAEEVRLVVGDNGRGFEPSDFDPSHMGLRSMRERAQEAGGRFDIVTGPGSGTVITVDWKQRSACSVPGYLDTHAAPKPGS